MRSWPHAPPHDVWANAAYMVTAGTYRKQHLLCSRERLDLVQAEMLHLADRYGWDLHAWAVFSNHYHLVAVRRPGAATLTVMTRHLHSVTARAINALDG